MTPNSQKGLVKVTLSHVGMPDERLTVNRQARRWEQREQEDNNETTIRLYATKVDNECPVNKLEANRKIL
jgi:hypothetical protein